MLSSMTLPAPRRTEVVAARRPHVVVHVAVSLDGATTGFDPDVERFYELARMWREDVTLVGADTILAHSTPTRPLERGHAADYVTGLLMTLLNPMTLAFWFVAVPALVGSITDDPAKDLPAVCAGVFVGTIGWVVVFSAGLSLAGRFRRNWWLAAADAVGGASLLLFAGTALVASVRAAWRG